MRGWWRRRRRRSGGEKWGREKEKEPLLQPAHRGDGEQICNVCRHDGLSVTPVLPASSSHACAIGTISRTAGASSPHRHLSSPLITSPRIPSVPPHIWLQHRGHIREIWFHRKESKLKPALVVGHPGPLEPGSARTRPYRVGWHD
ncbi:unnamed protein product [Merluccius merluccius]